MNPFSMSLMRVELRTSWDCNTNHLWYLSIPQKYIFPGIKVVWLGSTVLSRIFGSGDRAAAQGTEPRFCLSYTGIPWCPGWSSPALFSFTSWLTPDQHNPQGLLLSCFIHWPQPKDCRRCPSAVMLVGQGQHEDARWLKGGLFPGQDYQPTSKIHTLAGWSFDGPDS